MVDDGIQIPLLSLENLLPHMPCITRTTTLSEESLTFHSIVTLQIQTLEPIKIIDTKVMSSEEHLNFFNIHNRLYDETRIRPGADAYETSASSGEVETARTKSPDGLFPDVAEQMIIVQPSSGVLGHQLQTAVHQFLRRPISLYQVEEALDIHKDHTASTSTTQTYFFLIYQTPR